MAVQFTLGLLVVCISLHFSTQGKLLDRLEGASELMKAMDNLSKCRESTGATEEEVRHMIDTHEVPTSRAGQCLIACMAETYGVFQNGKFDATAALRVVDKVLGRVGREKDAELRSEIEAIVNSCGSRGSSAQDSCQNAAAIAGCGVQQSETLKAMRAQKQQG